MQYELFIGLRYTRAKRRNHFISFISLISMCGIALGVAALIVVLSVMNGFQKELRTRILGVASHVQISGPGGELAAWQQVADQARGKQAGAAARPTSPPRACCPSTRRCAARWCAACCRMPRSKVADFNRTCAGQLDAASSPASSASCSAPSWRAPCGVFTGDKVTLIAPQGLVTPAAILPRLKQFKVVGIFEAGMYEYDSGLALVHLADAQALYRMEDRVSGVRLKLDDLFAGAARGARAAQPCRGRRAHRDWTRSHANFFRAVQIEKNVMFIILLLIVAVAAFNIVSTLVMAVTDKQATSPSCARWGRARAASCRCSSCRAR
jgi:lipoprotein-releasing system permease protein